MVGGEGGDLEELRKALVATHTLWGGRFNPLIPLGDFVLARSLIKVFRVDCLYCVSQSSEGDAIRVEFKHLLWPGFEKNCSYRDPTDRWLHS